MLFERQQRIYNGSKPRQQVLTFLNIRLGSFSWNNLWIIRITCSSCADILTWYDMCEFFLIYKLQHQDCVHCNAGTKVQVESVAPPLLNFPQLCFFLNVVSHNLAMQQLKFSIELNMISCPIWIWFLNGYCCRHSRQESATTETISKAFFWCCDWFSVSPDHSWTFFCCHIFHIFMFSLIWILCAAKHITTHNCGYKAFAMSPFKLRIKRIKLHHLSLKLLVCNCPCWW